MRAARRSLRAALHRLAGVEAVPDHPYTVPWIVLLGPPEAGIAGLHEAVDPAEPGDPAANTITRAALGDPLLPRRRADRGPRSGCWRPRAGAVGSNG
ncbi:MAG: hypothetical protein WDN69_10580 [Aliidongia sp.]